MEQKLSDVISLRRRYSRSINLERDLTIIDSVLGYIPTSWTLDTSERILHAIIKDYSVRAWTITGVYGTGKSAFAHFLSALVAPKSDQIQHNAQTILEQYLGPNHPLIEHVLNHIPDAGLIRAVATAQREPISYTIVRALRRGCELVWSDNFEQHTTAITIHRLEEQIEADQKIAHQDIFQCIQQIFQETQMGILLTIDELGKSLEYAAWHQESDDLYLLQQLAELPASERTPKIFILGLLHQSFAEYALNLTKAQRNEWSKIQGRFEDIPFTTSNNHMLHLISQAIDHSHDQNQIPFLPSWASDWQHTLHAHDINQERLKVDEFSNIYPLHPLSALTLPILCNRYAQNDRSLFTFLTSLEPFSFTSFLHTTKLQGEQPTTLKLHRIYDYFVEASSISNNTKSSNQRWIEIQGRIVDAQHLGADLVMALKTIGILNLVDTVGTLRATSQLVVLALSEDPNNKQEKHRWTQTIELLIKRGLITYRKQLDELRIWEGSDFDIEQATTSAIEKEQASLAVLLTQSYPLTPLIAQRHSYKTGTLRYFERRYIDKYEDLAHINPSSQESDGVIGYWLADTLPAHCPTSTTNGKPFILIAGKNIEKLAIVSREVAALITIEAKAPQLQSDGVARREVRQRLTQTKRVLIDLLEQSFLSGKEAAPCHSYGTVLNIRSLKDFQQHLSLLCDQIYPKTPILWNELINRREITSQGAKARRELLEAMLNNSHLERLGLEGNGPESSIYMSLLNHSGIHRYIDGQWSFVEPTDPTILWIWNTIEQFCLNARSKPETLDQLYAILEAPPYGMKKGTIPLLLAAVLLHHKDDVSVYLDGTFIPLLGAENFELLVKQPSRFAVKHFEVTGLRTQVFKELALLLRRPQSSNISSTRNNTILSIVKPLIQFGNSLPLYTVKTKQLSLESIAIRNAIREAREPDELLFTTLPQACGLTPISTVAIQDDAQVQQLKEILVRSLQELQLAYDCLLDKCKFLLYNTFTVRSDLSKLREDLRVRAQYLKDNCIERQMRSFLFAAVNDTINEKEWLEALLMVVADKPAVSWTDEDVTLFEIHLGDLARRFSHLEAIQKEAYQQTPSGFIARRITVTQPDGYENNHIIWLNEEHQAQIESLVDDILKHQLVYQNEQLQQELVAALVNKVFHSTAHEQYASRSPKRGKEA